MTSFITIFVCALICGVVCSAQSVSDANANLDVNAVRVATLMFFIYCCSHYVLTCNVLQAKTVLSVVVSPRAKRVLSIVLLMVRNSHMLAISILFPDLCLNFVCEKYFKCMRGACVWDNTEYLRINAAINAECVSLNCQSNERCERTNNVTSCVTVDLCAGLTCSSCMTCNRANGKCEDDNTIASCVDIVRF
jgi:hypothetical protein